MTDHSRNVSRTYEGTTDIIPAFLSTDFGSDDHIYVGGLPDGVMVSELSLHLSSRRSFASLFAFTQLNFETNYTNIYVLTFYTAINLVRHLTFPTIA